MTMTESAPERILPVQSGTWGRTGRAQAAGGTAIAPSRHAIRPGVEAAQARRAPPRAELIEGRSSHVAIAAAESGQRGPRERGGGLDAAACRVRDRTEVRPRFAGHDAGRPGRAPRVPAAAAQAEPDGRHPLPRIVPLGRRDGRRRRHSALPVRTRGRRGRAVRPARGGDVRANGRAAVDPGGWQAPSSGSTSSSSRASSRAQRDSCSAPTCSRPTARTWRGARPW